MKRAVKECPMDSLVRSSYVHDASPALGGTSQATGASGRDDAQFSALLSTFMDSPAANVTPTLDVYTELKNNADVLATTDPYIGQDDAAAGASSVSTLEGADIPTSEIRFTDEEVRQIADNLRKEDPEAARRVEDLAGHPGGVSVAEVVSAVAYEEPANLTDGDLARIEALTTELDPSGELGKSVLADLRNGNVASAWASLSNALKQLDPDMALSVNKDQVLSLGKALRLPQTTLAKLNAAFGGAEELSFTPDGLKKFLAPIQQGVAEKLESRVKLAATLETAMKDVVSAARKRLELEAQAAGRGSRRVDQSQTLIEDTVTRNGFTRAADATAEAAVKTDDAAKATRAGEDLAADVRAQAGQTAADKTTEQAGRRQDQQGRNLADRNAGDGNPRGENSRAARNADTLAETATRREGQADPWESLLNRLDAASRVPGTTSPLAAASQNASVAAGNPAGAAARGATPSPYSAQVLNQVEKGLLSAMSNGTTRLELQLNPVELGAVNVLLTTKNGEVSALLRPESPETASLLTQQLGELRAELEQQGIKVDKVDVQTQVRDEHGMTWQGMEQHNATRDQRSRTEELDRLRRLSRVGGGRDMGGRLASVARPSVLAGMSHFSSSTGGGLHLVA